MNGKHISYLENKIKQCSKCKTELPLDSFSCTVRLENGECKYYNSWCNACRTKQNRERLGLKEKPKPKIVGDSKTCLTCGILKHKNEFYFSTRGRLKRSSYCKSCTERPAPEKARAYTQKYRDNNRLRWRALHRLNMLKRRLQIENVSDGTVTDEFLQFVYSQELCCWCKEFVEFSDRTLEHIIELSHGGVHGISNITMACVSCNSSRLNKNSSEKLISSLEEEFNRSKDDNQC